MEVIFVVVGIIIVLMLMMFMFSGSSSNTTAAAAGSTADKSTSCTSTSCTNGNTCGSTGNCVCGTLAACTGSGVCSNGTCLGPDGTDCADGSTCVGGNCYYKKCTTPISTTTCTKPSDCGTDLSTTDCVEGVCLSKPAAYGCNPGCADGYSCISGKCVNNYKPPKCMTDPTTHKCSTFYSEVCANTGCTLNIADCTTQSDCIIFGSSTESSCINGYCACGGITMDQNYICISNTLYPVSSASSGLYSGSDRILDGYTDYYSLYACGGQICSYGQICNNAKCGPPCTSTSCTNGYSCDTSTGTCSCNGIACTGGQLCVNGSCTNTNTGIACNETNPCTTGECYYGYCINSSGECNIPSDCNDGGTDTDCVNGKCLSKPPMYGCNPGCADGYICDNGKCIFISYPIAGCTAGLANSCPTGQACSTFGCADNNTLISCNTNSDCSPYSSDPYCLKDDSSGDSFCAFGNSYSTYLFQYTQSFSGSNYDYNTGNPCTSDATAPSYIPLLNYTCNTSTGYYTCGTSGVCPTGQVCSTNQTCITDTSY